MRKVLRIEDHPGFQRVVGRCVLAGGAVALLSSASPPPFWLGLSGVAGLSAALAPPRSWGAGAGLAVRALCGGVLFGVAGHGGARGGAALCGLALCVGWSLYNEAGATAEAEPAEGEAATPGWRRGLAVAVGALLTLGALRVLDVIPGQLLSRFDDLPGQVPLLLGGLGAGLVLGLSAITSRLRLRDEAHAAAPNLLVGAGDDEELGGLLAQAGRSYQEAVAALAEHKPALRAAEALMQRIARFGQRWQEISAQARRSDRGALEARLADLKAREDAATDDQVRGEYRRAATAVTAQLDALREIHAGRERAIAKLHHQVATLERLRLLALRHRSVDAARQGEELRAIVDDLNQAGTELEAASEALSVIPG